MPRFASGAVVPTSQEDIAYLPVTEMLRLFHTRALSPVEALQAQVDRADALTATVNPFTWRFTEEAIAQARAAEARYLGKGPEPRPLEGVTLAIKEEMPVAGQPVTHASRIYANEIADHTAPLAERRSEEHTSELQSRQYLVCRLLLEKKKKHIKLQHCTC